MHERADRTRRPRRLLGPGLAAALALTGILSSHASAGAPAQPAAPDPRAAYVSELVTQLALLDLGMQQLPQARDYELAYHLLEIAALLDPTDLELRHQLIAAAWGTADQQLLIDASRGVVALDPKDTVAQLRVITSIISQSQTAEARLESYDRFLGRAGENLDPAVRSRLALDAALLARELGDEQGFVQRLSLATTLDMTNKEAAAMAAAFHTERRQVPPEQLEMLVNLLYADPVDPNVHNTIADLLARQGAFSQARRFASNSSIIRQRSGRGNIEVLERDLIYRWHTQGPQAVLDGLNDSLAAQRSQVAVNAAIAEASQIPVLDMKSPEDIRLDPTLDRIRILAAAAVGDTQSMDSAIADMTAEMEITVRALVSSVETTDERTKLQAIRQIAGLFNQAHFVRTLVGYKPDESAAAFQNFSSIAPEIRALISTLIPWISLRLDQTELAGEQAELIRDPAAISLLRAELAVINNDKQAAARHYLDVLRQAPVTPIGCWAHAKLIQLTGSQDFRTPDGRRMAAFAASVDEVIDRMCYNTLDFLALRIEPVQTTLGATDHARLRISVQNVAPIPLALGAGRPISSRILLQPKLDTETGDFKGDAQPRVLDMDRRLRLMPLEVLEFEVTADSPYTQWLLDINAGATMRQRWRALQGFISAGEEGSMLPGPLCLSAETTRSVVRLALPTAVSPPKELARRLRHDPREALPATLFGVRALLLRDPGASAALDTPEIEDMVLAATERYERADSLGRAMMLTILPHARMSRQMAPFEIAVRKSLAERLKAGEPVTELEAAIVLATRAPGAEDPLLAAMKSSSSPRIAAIASVLVLRYEENGFGYATVPPNLDAIAGPTITQLRRRIEQTQAGSP